MDTDQEQPTRVPKWDKVVFGTLRAIDEIKDRTLGQLKRNFVYDLLGDEAIEYIRCHPWPVRLERGLVPSERSLFFVLIHGRWVGFRRVKLRLPPGMGKELERCVEVSFYIHGKRDTKSGEEFRFIGDKLQDETLKFLRELATIFDKVNRPLFIHPVDERRGVIYENYLMRRKTSEQPVYILKDKGKTLDCIQHVEGHGNVMSSFSLRRDNFSHPDGPGEL